MKKILRIKNLKSWDEYSVADCAASRCVSGSDVVLATKVIAPVDIGLCDYHWEVYCERIENALENKRGA